MKQFAIGIINHGTTYELQRTLRFVKESYPEYECFDANQTSLLKERKEEYIAFYDVFDVWKNQKIEKCLSILTSDKSDEEPDVLVHSYIQHVGRSTAICLIENKNDLAEKIMVYGFPSVSTMVFKTQWITELCEKARCNGVQIGSSEFYSMLEQKLMNTDTGIRFCPDVLSENWTFWGNLAPKNTELHTELLDMWSKNTEVLIDKGAFMSCYLCYKECFPLQSPAAFFDIFTAKKENVAKIIEQVLAANAQSVKVLNNSLNRKNNFYSLLCRWIDLHHTGKTIADVLVNQNIKTVAIYGAGKHGKMVFDELESSAVKVLYWLDNQKNEETVCGCRVVSLDEHLQSVDAIIVTPYLEFSTIGQQLQSKTNAKIMSLADIVGK